MASTDTVTVGPGTTAQAVLRAISAAIAPLWGRLAAEVFALVPDHVQRMRFATNEWPRVHATAETGDGRPVLLEPGVTAAVERWCTRRTKALRLLAAEDDAGAVWLDRTDITTPVAVGRDGDGARLTETLQTLQSTLTFLGNRHPSVDHRSHANDLSRARQLVDAAREALRLTVTNVVAAGLLGDDPFDVGIAVEVAVGRHAHLVADLAPAMADTRSWAPYIRRCCPTPTPKAKTGIGQDPPITVSCASCHADLVVLTGGAVAPAEQHRRPPRPRTDGAEVAS